MTRLDSLILLSLGRKSFSDHTFDDLLWVSGEFWVRIDVVKVLLFEIHFMAFYNPENNIVRQHPWKVGRQGISEDTVQDQNEIDNVGCQKFRR
jgi:hypothetical protein